MNIVPQSTALLAKSMALPRLLPRAPTPSLNTGSGSLSLLVCVPQSVMGKDLCVTMMHVSVSDVLYCFILLSAESCIPS